MTNQRFIAADIGNARIKLGLFTDDNGIGLLEPRQTLLLLGKEAELDGIDPWLAGTACDDFSRDLPHLPYQWWIASVNRPAATGLIDWLHEHRAGDRVVLLASGDLPLVVRVERPDMVGVDRLVDAVAVNRLRDAGHPAVIVDVGTAITVDLVSGDGAFLGGAILPGIQMSARALHHFTDLLPLVDVAELAVPPPALGDSTESAMRSGLFWGAVGAIRELIERICETASDWGGSSTATPAHSTATATQSETASGGGPQVFVTGGAGPAVAELLGRAARHVPNLTLAGIAQAARERRSAGKSSSV
ncbi:MAG: type III pantothenate kinase [Thermoguttaceae bacterium]|jgi:type III pantothenate kinase